MPVSGKITPTKPSKPAFTKPTPGKSCFLGVIAQVLLRRCCHSQVNDNIFTVSFFISNSYPELGSRVPT